MEDRTKKVIAGIGLVGGGASAGGAYTGGKYLAKKLRELPPKLKSKILEGAIIGGVSGAGLLTLLLASGVLNKKNAPLPPEYYSEG